MRIALIHIGQETNDFNPLPTTVRDYESFGIFEGPEILDKLRGLGQVGGHLEAILRLGISSRAIIPLIEPQTVARLVAAGEGARVTLAVGGHADTGFFQPLIVSGTVRRIGSGQVPVANYYQDAVDMGRVVVFDVGPVTLLVSELRGVAGNMPDVYRAFGVEPTDYKMAVLKTASNFQYFAPIASQVIRVDTTGPGQSDVFGLPWTRIPRPVYPLDPIDDWRGAGVG